MNEALRRRWLMVVVQPTMMLRETAEAASPYDYKLTGTSAVVFIFVVSASVVAFIVRFLVLRRQARAARYRRDQAEAALAESEARYRLLFDHNPCPMCVYDSSTLAILELNDAAVERYGYTRAELARMTLQDLRAPDDPARLEAAPDDEPVGTRAPEVGKHRTKDGRTIDVEVHQHPLALANRRARLLVITDVTKRLAAERDLRETETQARVTSEVLQSLFDVAPQAIVVVDADWRVTQWNRAAEALFGWTADEVLGKPSPFLPEDGPGDARARHMAAEMSGYGRPGEATRTRKDGTQVDTLLAAVALSDAEGRRTGSISVFTDLTERKLLEEQLRQSQKMEAIGTLAGGIAHDFNNILTVITSYSSMLLAEPRSDKERANLEEVAKAAKRATELTRQLLAFGRKAIVRLRPVNVNDTVNGMRAMLRRLLTTNIEVVTTLAPVLGFIVADPGQLEQIIMNLAVNASDAMPDGGTLIIETRDVELNEEYAKTHASVRPGTYVMLAVSDTGTGMDAATISKIFEPFFTTKEVGRGTGLGLATVYAIVNQLGGSIWVYSEVGHGTTFKVYLPRDDTRRSAATPTSVAASRVNAGTVLLVEDDEPVRRAVRRMLERFGHTVLEAADGEAGLVVVSNHSGPIDAVVTDLMMPRMNGRAFAAALEKARPGLPVVFTSGYTDDAVLRRGLVGENHTFLQKPFTGEQLAQAIAGLTDADSADAIP